MVVDSGAEVHLVCPAHKHFMKNLSKLDVPLQLETAGGDLTLLTVNLFSTSRGEEDGNFFERCSLRAKEC